jgi:hypothetical protein
MLLLFMAVLAVMNGGRMVCVLSSCRLMMWKMRPTAKLRELYRFSGVVARRQLVGVGLPSNIAGMGLLTERRRAANVLSRGRSVPNHYRFR